MRQFYSRNLGQHGIWTSNIDRQRSYGNVAYLSIPATCSWHSTFRPSDIRTCGHTWSLSSRSLACSGCGSSGGTRSPWCRIWGPRTRDADLGKESDMADLRRKQLNINISVPSLGWYGVVAVNSNYVYAFNYSLLLVWSQQHTFLSNTWGTKRY